MRRVLLLPAVLAPLALAAACGSSRITTNTSTPPRVASTPHPPILTITASGIEPREAHFGDPTELTIVNADTRPHSIYTDRHPSHDQYKECAMMNVGLLEPGERRVLPPPSHIACFYHDENDPDDQAFWGFFISH
jgi:hypothetical protein